MKTGSGEVYLRIDQGSNLTYLQTTPYPHSEPQITETSLSRVVQHSFSAQLHIHAQHHIPHILVSYTHASLRYLLVVVLLGFSTDVRTKESASK